MSGASTCTGPDADGKYSGFCDFKTASPALMATLKPFWNYASYCDGYPSRWCAASSQCNYCQTLRTSHGVDRNCTDGGASDPDCYYCDGSKSKSCNTTLTCSDGTGACTDGTNDYAGAACDDASGVCVGDCYKYYGTCNAVTLVCSADSVTQCASGAAAGSSCTVGATTGTCRAVCSVDGTTLCSSTDAVGASCTVGATTGTCQGFGCTLDTTRLCATNANCIDNYTGSESGTGDGCITNDTCTIAAAGTCKEECNKDDCTTQVIKYLRGFDSPTNISAAVKSPGKDFRFRHDTITTSDNMSTNKLGDIVYSTPRISPNSAVNGYDVTYKDTTYSNWVKGKIKGNCSGTDA